MYKEKNQSKKRILFWAEHGSHSHQYSVGFYLLISGDRLFLLQFLPNITWQDFDNVYRGADSEQPLMVTSHSSLYFYGMNGISNEVLLGQSETKGQL